MPHPLFVKWSDFREVLKEDAKPGRHIAVLAPTGGGKTTLSIKGLLPYFETALVIDSTADPNPPLRDYGKALQKFGPIKDHRRLTVNAINSDTQRQIHRAVDKAFRQGNCAVYIDEVRQIADKNYFGLQKMLEYLWLFGRKRGVTVIGVTQAPRFVPSAFYDQSKLHFLFKIRDKRAMKRITEISGDVDTLEDILPTLGDYEFAYVNPSGDVSVSKMFYRGSTKNA